MTAEAPAPPQSWWSRVHSPVSPARAGRCQGWRAARGISRPRTAVPGVDTSIGFVESLRMRSSDRAAK